MSRAAITLVTGLEDPEKVMVALLTAIAAAEGGRSTLIFLTKEAVRLAVTGVATGTACDGCPPIEELMNRYAAAGGEFIACSVCVNSKKLDPDTFVPNARVAGTVQLWEWIGDGATTFSF
ncbi:DsrE family protein [Gordonia sp. NPDC003424]